MTLAEVATAYPSANQTAKTDLLGIVAKDNLFDTDFHSLKQYASDTNTTLYVTDGSASSRSEFIGSTTSPVCFVSGTQISTTEGNTAVEDLVVGNLAVITDVANSPIRWLGHRTIDCRRHSSPAEVMPIRIAAHAFAPNKPIRDLYVSPGHAICVDAYGEVLIPAGSLVNGTTIVQVEVETVTYWHVELDEHEIILAEGLPCESYLEMRNRSFFVENGTVLLAASPDAVVRTHADFCRPYYADGPLVDAVRARLGARADVLKSEPIKRVA